jgi:serine/threonine-protein kinase
MRCPACGTSNPTTQRFCGSCGAVLVHSESETLASPVPPRAPADGAQFVPGQILAERYRMIGLLGRGGMGEVYRADDLKLGQQVALKFLPRDVESDRDRLSRFMNEVRLSLRVTHPNVCRVFDIADVGGRHFLSMEYVDGEDLASLLRRIGRLPEDKAVEIARQLCAGLAAAHDEGVLHRDLKPANVMIDGRGRAKITDFGLAGATAGVIGREAQAGTPQYMAPEQFDGRELSIQTDLYSLGLVLYELFTGKRAFNSRDIHELAAMRSSTPTSPSAHVSGLSPVVERAILRCLDPDPTNRPRSASSLAAALPGGDPLAMAIAAGETPSPEMVARSGGQGELKPAVAAGCLAVVLAGLGLIWYHFGTHGLQNLVPLPKPPAELRVIARGVLVAAGYTPKNAGIASGYARDPEYFAHVERTNSSASRWDNLASVSPAPVWFWYRESPRPITPMGAIEQVTSLNPPIVEPGMSRLLLDPAGRIRSFRVVPTDLPETPGPWAEPDWAPLFVSAGYVQSEWTPTEPRWAPTEGSDVRRAWTKDKLLIEAGSFRGRVVSFRVIPEWRRPDEVRLAEPQSNTPPLGFVALQLVVIVGGALIARRNMRQGRSDRRGALRLAAVYVGTGAGASLLRGSGDAAQWFTMFQRNVAYELYLGCLVWLFYLAVEPYVRRLWPGTLIAWSRALEGRFRDPMVGRHILLGALAGLGFSILFMLPELAASAGVAGPAPASNLGSLASTAAYLNTFLFSVQESFMIPVSALMGVLVFRVVFRRPWLAYLVLIAVMSALSLTLPSAGPLQSARLLGVVVLMLVVLTRLGLFALLVAILFSSWDGLGPTIDPSSWFFPQSVVTIAIFAALAIFGFWVSLGDQKVFKDSLLER